MTPLSKYNLCTCRTWTATVLFVMVAMFGGLFAVPSGAMAAQGTSSNHDCCGPSVAESDPCEPAVDCGMIQMPQDCRCRISTDDNRPVGHVLALSNSTVTFGPAIAPQSNPHVDLPLPRAPGLVPTAEHLRPSPPSQPLYILNNILLI